MNLKGLIFISILFLITNWSCEKEGDLIELRFYETGCANPWSVNNRDPDYQDKVKKYLEEQNITIKNISISNDGPASICASCDCTTGRTINITIYEQDKTLALDLGFFIKINTDCKSAICTEEFRSIAISIKHKSDNTAFVLTDYKVIRLSDNKVITITDDNLTDNNGYYQITNDLKLDLFKFKNTEVEFKGYLNDVLVIQKRLTITSDCCHISLVVGETEFLL